MNNPNQLSTKKDTKRLNHHKDIISERIRDVLKYKIQWILTAELADKRIQNLELEKKLIQDEVESILINF